MEVMNGGTGETSYSSNSLVQKKVLLITKPIIEEAILDIFSKYYSTINIPKNSSSSSIGIADLGCSSGRNTLLVVSYLIDTIYNKCCESGRASPEFLVFLNDLPGNDFNTIFKSLQGFFDEQKETKGDGFGPCFIAGMPGTFYGRLFPSQTLHFVHSSNSLHWLSQVPPGIGQSNKGNIYMAKSSPPTVLEAYSKQFQTDFWVFLRSRSEEVVEGGKMVITLSGRRSEDPFSEELCYFAELLTVALKDMVSKGKIEDEKLDSFNIPSYTPFPEELKFVIESEGSFMVEHLKTDIEVNWDGEDGHIVVDKVRSSYNIVSCIRAVLESLLVSHFGQAIMDELFCKYREILADHMPDEKLKSRNVVICMTRGRRCYSDSIRAEYRLKIDPKSPVGVSAGRFSVNNGSVSSQLVGRTTVHESCNNALMTVHSSESPPTKEEITELIKAYNARMAIVAGSS